MPAALAIPWNCELGSASRDSGEPCQSIYDADCGGDRNDDQNEKANETELTNEDEFLVSPARRVFLCPAQEPCPLLRFHNLLDNILEVDFEFHLSACAHCHTVFVFVLDNLLDNMLEVDFDFHLSLCSACARLSAQCRMQTQSCIGNS